MSIELRNLDPEEFEFVRPPSDPDRVVVYLGHDGKVYRLDHLGSHKRLTADEALPYLLQALGARPMFHVKQEE